MKKKHVKRTRQGHTQHLRSKKQADENYPEQGTAEYQSYLAKLKILEEIRLKKLKALELLCKSPPPLI